MDNTYNLLSGNRFQLVIPVLPFPNTIGRELTLNIYGTVIPGNSMNVETLDWQGGFARFPIGSKNHNPFTFNFIVDEDFTNWRTFNDWMDWITDEDDHYTRSFPDFCVNPALIIYDGFGKQVLQITLINAWVKAIGDVRLNTREGQTYLECDATLEYDRLVTEKYQ